jgi:TP901 family phage tail tape measure protein
MIVGELKALLELDYIRYDRDIDKAEKRFLEFGKNQKPLKIKVDTGGAEKEITGVSSALAKQKREGASWAREIEASAKRAGVSYTRFGDVIKTTTREEKASLADQSRAASAWSKDIERDMKRAGVAVDRYGDRVDVAARKARAQQARGQLGRDIGNTASVAGAGILAGLGAATKVSVDFSQEMRNVNSIAQLSEERLDALKKSVVEIARDPQVLQGPRGLSEALYDVYSSGFEGAKALDVLRVAAQGASAGNTDAATSGKVLMATLNSGIPGVESAAQAMDVLFKTVDRGVVTFPELAGSLGAILPTAAKAEVSLQQVGAAVALMTKSGQSASESTNDLLNLLSKIANPSQEAEKQFKALGISYGFAGLQAKGLPGVLEEIQKKTGGNADAIKKLLPDLQAQRAALSLLKNGGKDYVAELAEMEKASEGVGAKTAALNQQLKGEGAGMENFNKNLEILAITASSTLLPALNDLLEASGELFKWFSSLPEETQQNIVKGTALAGVFLLVGGRVTAVIELLVLLKQAQLASAAAGATSAASTGAAWGKLAAVGGPLALVAISIAGIATAFYGTQDAGTMSADALREKWGPLAGIWDSGATALNNIANKLLEIANSPGITALSKVSPAVALWRWNVNRDAPNYATEKPDGSHAGGLDFVPKDNYKANLHKGEAVLDAKAAEAWRADTKRTAPPGASSTDFIRNLYSRYNLASKVDQTCADVASKTITALGFHLKKSVNAAQLEKNAIAGGWQKVNPSQAPPGSLMVGPGGGPSGRHTVVSLGGRRAISSSRHKVSEYNVGRGYTAYAPPGAGEGGGDIPAIATEAARAEKERLEAIQRRVAASNADSASIKERNYLLQFEQKLLKDTSLTMDQVNARLEDEANRRKRIKELVESGYTQKQAEVIAHVRLAQERANSSIETANELLKTQREKTLEIIKAGEERMSARAGEMAGMREYSASLQREGELLANQLLTQREVNRSLEAEAYLRERIAHWKEQGYSPTQAAALGNQDITTFKNDRAQQDANDAKKQARENIIEAASDAGAALVQLKDASVRANFEAINSLMDDTELSVERIAQTLSGLDSAIGRGELLPLAMPDDSQIAAMMGIGKQNDLKAKLDELGGRIGGESGAAASTLFAELNRDRDPLDITADSVKSLRDEINLLKEDAAAQGVDMSGFTQGFDRWSQILDNIVPKLKQAREIAESDFLSKAFQEMCDARKLLDFAPGFERDQAGYRMQLEQDERFKKKPAVIDSMVNERGGLIRQGNAQDWADDLRRRIEYATADTELDRWMLNLKEQWKRDGFTDEEVKAMLPFERALKESETAKDVIRGHADDMKNILSGGIQSAFKGDFEGGLKGIISSFSERMMTQMADNIAQGWTEKVMSGPWQQAGGAGQIFPQQPGGFLGFGGINGIAGPTLAMAGAKPAEPKKPKWYETLGGALGLPMGASGAMAGAAAGGNGNAIITIQSAVINAVTTQATIGSMQADVSFAMINAQGGMGGGSGEAGSSPSGDQLGEGILGGLLSGSGGLASKLFRN